MSVHPGFAATALAEPTAAGLRGAQWPSLGTTARVVVTDGDMLAAARSLLTAELTALDRACSRLRPDAEIRRLEAARGRPVTVSPLLASAVRVALDSARASGGDLDPTVGTALVDLGYGRAARGTPGWRQVHVDLERGTITAPAGTLLDLGATAKAWLADRAAHLIAERLECGVLVGLGGHVATAGPVPAGGWTIRIQNRPDAAADPTGCLVTLPRGGAVATSRSARRGGPPGQRLLDPRALHPAEPVWRYVTVVAASCVAANVASATAVLRGTAALEWLTGRAVAARLVAADGTVRTVGSWPQGAEEAAGWALSRPPQPR